jgi:hypothetical protein
MEFVHPYISIDPDYRNAETVGGQPSSSKSQAVNFGSKLNHYLNSVVNSLNKTAASVVKTVSNQSNKFRVNQLEPVVRTVQDTSKVVGDIAAIASLAGVREADSVVVKAEDARRRAQNVDYSQTELRPMKVSLDEYKARILKREEEEEQKRKKKSRNRSSQSGDSVLKADPNSRGKKKSRRRR